LAELLFDTNVLIDHLHGVKEANELIISVEEGRITGYISTLTEVELFAGKEVENPRIRELVAELTDLFCKVEPGSTIARLAGEFRRRYNVKLADAVIAATAADTGYKLLTKNLSDFKNIREIVAEEPY
jgi:tRNA(fMet)-specific endonuclease VapC